MTHTSTPISLTHTPPAHSQTEIRITRRCLWVKNIIKVINLYLNRPLRVFPVCLGEGRKRTRFPRSLSALCNYVHVSSEIRSWRRLLDQVKKSSPGALDSYVADAAGGCSPVFLRTFRRANGAPVPTRGSVLQKKRTPAPSDSLPCSGTVIWVRCWGWRRNPNAWGTAGGWPWRTWGIAWGCTGPRCAASTEAPRSPWTVSC